MGGGGGAAPAGGPAGGPSGNKTGEAGAREREVLAWVDANTPGAFAAWTPVTLADGTRAEVGGLDPFVELNPPMAILKPRWRAHRTGSHRGQYPGSRSCRRLTDSGASLRVKAVAGNRGYLAPTQEAERAGSTCQCGWNPADRPGSTS